VLAVTVSDLDDLRDSIISVMVPPIPVRISALTSAIPQNQSADKPISGTVSVSRQNR
jgi:hypothetical protein